MIEDMYEGKLEGILLEETLGEYFLHHDSKLV